MDMGKDTKNIEMDKLYDSSHYEYFDVTKQKQWQGEVLAYWNLVDFEYSHFNLFSIYPCGLVFILGIVCTDGISFINNHHQNGYDW
jgi:hypothetical protein